MRRKLIVSLIAAMLLLLLVEIEGAGAHSKGRAIIRSKGSTSIIVVHRKPFVQRRFIHRRFIHRPNVIFKLHSPYYYRRSYRSDYGYSYYKPYTYSKPYNYYRPSYSETSLSILAIVDMASGGVPDVVIIDEINRTNSYFELNAEVIAYLKENKVSDRVIDYMWARRK